MFGNDQLAELADASIGTSRAAPDLRIEQAKGVLHAKLAVSPGEAFELLKRSSQNTNQKVRVVAGRLVRDEIDARQVRAQASSRNGTSRTP